MSETTETEVTHSIAGATRSLGAGATHTTIAEGYEQREIVVAQGVEAHNSDLPDEPPNDWTVPNGLRRLVPDLDIQSPSSATYLSREQGVRFVIRVITRKDEYKTALETAGLHVVYLGHARYGRGPCFGDNREPGEWWGNGTSFLDGMFRMGYPFVAVPVTEIIKHGYTATPVSTETGRPPRTECHPDIRGAYSRLREYTLEELPPELHQNLNASAGARFFGFTKYDHGHRKRYLVLRAGWENTATYPLDLGATDLRCRVFVHMGCSTFKHNYRILRFGKNWQRTDNDRFAYWTTAPSNGVTLVHWLHRLLTYPTYNAFQSWRESLRYAVQRTNRDLRREGFRYRLI